MLNPCPTCGATFDGDLCPRCHPPRRPAERTRANPSGKGGSGQKNRGYMVKGAGDKTKKKHTEKQEKQDRREVTLKQMRLSARP